MAILTLTWKTAGDSKVCPVCQALEGYVWVFETGKHAFPLKLAHSSLGEVWDVSTGPLTHGHSAINCRCRIEPEFNLQDLIQKVQTLLETVESETQETIE